MSDLPGQHKTALPDLYKKPVPDLNKKLVTDLYKKPVLDFFTAPLPPGQEKKLVTGNGDMVLEIGPSEERRKEKKMCDANDIEAAEVKKMLGEAELDWVGGSRDTIV